MYRPNFCCECGEKVIRLRWRVWHSRSFCNRCAKPLRKERIGRPIVIGMLLVCLGLVAGRAMRPAPPPLIIQRAANSPLWNSASEGTTTQPSAIVQQTYTCGARTKKGTPCSRRVHGPVRCWQHKGMQPMLPQEKLAVKE